MAPIPIAVPATIKFTIQEAMTKTYLTCATRTPSGSEISVRSHNPSHSLRWSEEREQESQIPSQHPPRQRPTTDGRRFRDHLGMWLGHQPRPWGDEFQKWFHMFGNGSRMQAYH